MITDFFANTSTPVSVSAAAVVALLSAANMAGRIGWSSTSDLIGRKNIFTASTSAWAPSCIC